MEEKNTIEKNIIKYKNGDKDAFRQIIEYVENDLYGVAVNRLESIDDVNEAIQNTIISIYKNIRKLKEPKYFKTWAIRILINESNKIYKNNKKNGKLEENLYLEKTFSNNEDISDITRLENNIDFERAINFLSNDEKIIITLKYNSQFSFEDISRILKVNINTVKTKFFRAKEKLRAFYTERSIKDE